jgi:hypothetical protein
MNSAPPAPRAPAGGDRRLLVPLAIAVLLYTVALQPAVAARVGTAAAGLLAALALLWSAYGWGRFILARTSGVDGDRPPEWALITGLLILSHGAFIAGAVGRFSIAWILLLLAAGCVMAGRPRGLPDPRILFRWETAPALIALLLAALTPVFFWDSRSYHLAIPETMIETGGLIARSTYYYSHYPLAMEMLYAFLLWLPFGEVATVWLNALLLVIAIRCVARHEDDRARRNATSLLLTTPAVIMLLVFPKNTALLGLASIAAIDAAESWIKARGNGRNERGAALTIGAALGLVASTHYGGLWWVLVLGLWLLARSRGRIGLAMPAVFLLAAAPVYLRNALATGNPLHPFAGFLFDGAAYQPLAVGMDEVTSPMVWIERLWLPWTSLEGLGLGSSLGLLFPLGLLLLIGDRALRRDADRHRIGLGLLWLMIGTVLHSRPRYGIGGFLLLGPAAARGLRRLGRLERPLFFVNAVIGLTIVLSVFRFAPVLDGRSDTAFRNMHDATAPLAEFAAGSIAGRNVIANVAILRGYGWKARLEPSSEYHDPDLADVLRRSPDAATAATELRAMGYAFLALDGKELARLRAQYSYFILPEREERIFVELIEACAPLVAHGEAVLMELPPVGTATN